MSDTFEEKLQTLSSKLQNMERPCSLIERQSKCKDAFLDIRKRISEKFEVKNLTYAGRLKRTKAHRIKSLKVSVSD